MNGWWQVYEYGENVLTVSPFQEGSFTTIELCNGYVTKRVENSMINYKQYLTLTKALHTKCLFNGGSAKSVKAVR